LTLGKWFHWSPWPSKRKREHENDDGVSKLSNYSEEEEFWNGQILFTKQTKSFERNMFCVNPEGKVRVTAEVRRKKLPNSDLGSVLALRRRSRKSTTLWFPNSRFQALWLIKSVKVMLERSEWADSFFFWRKWEMSFWFSFSLMDSSSKGDHVPFPRADSAYTSDEWGRGRNSGPAALLLL